MAAPRYPIRHFRTGRSGISVEEGLLALSVIIGLMFVSVRIMNMGEPASMPQADGTATVVVTTETPPLAADASDTKTP
jgi:hypothetical protein